MDRRDREAVLGSAAGDARSGFGWRSGYWAAENHLTSWTIEATLSDAITSATAKPGQTIHATVATPVFNDDHTLAIPQGAILIGTVSQAQPSRSFAPLRHASFRVSPDVLPSGAAKSSHPI